MHVFDKFNVSLASETDAPSFTLALFRVSRSLPLTSANVGLFSGSVVQQSHNSSQSPSGDSTGTSHAFESATNSHLCRTFLFGGFDIVNSSQRIIPVMHYTDSQNRSARGGGVLKKVRSAPYQMKKHLPTCCKYFAIALQVQS